MILAKVHAKCRPYSSLGKDLGLRSGRLETWSRPKVVWGKIERCWLPFVALIVVKKSRVSSGGKGRTLGTDVRTSLSIDCSWSFM